MSTGLSTNVLLLEDRAEAMTPHTLKDTGLESSPGVEGVDAAGHLLSADCARVVGGVSSSGATAQSLEVSLRQTGTDPGLGLFLLKGAIEVALGYGDFLRGIEKLKALPLKERRRHMKNEVFRVGCVMT